MLKHRDKADTTDFRLSKITDILAVLLLSSIVCVMALVYLKDYQYYLILAVALSIVTNIIYIVLKIRSQPPPPPSKSGGQYP